MTLVSQFAKISASATSIPPYPGQRYFWFKFAAALRCAEIWDSNAAASYIHVVADGKVGTEYQYTTRRLL